MTIPSVPSPTFTSTGFSTPDEATQVLPAVKSDLNAIFGGALDMSDSTPQGQLAASISAILGFVNDMFLYYTQQLDPSYATGREQDALARIYFIERIPSQSTVVTATCTGGVGVVIPDGALAKAQDGNTYICSSGGTIPSTGSIDLSFYCSVAGAVSCPAGSLNQIYQSIAGWDSITNAADGVLGRDTETRDEFEARRYQSVANNAMGFLNAILGAVLQVSGVLDAYATENYTAAPVVVGGVTVAANSIYVAASGGAAADVAKAIWSKKPPGCGMTGTTSVTVYDDVNYDPPYPSYTINFEVPATLRVLFAVSIVNSDFVPSDAATQIQDAIISAFAGNDGGPRARIGATLYASRFYSTVAALGSWAQIVSIQIGSQNTAAAEITGFIDDGSGGGSPSSTAGTTLTVSSVASGAVAVGQTVVGDNVLSGTTILSGSGTTWTVSKSQLVGSETIYGVLADQNTVTAQIDQAPSVDADSIVVTLA